VLNTIRSDKKRHDVFVVWLLLASMMALTMLVYWPSLHGGYLFDDSIYFVENPDIHVTTLHLGDWVKAALSQAGSNQFRALSAVSFAANYYFTGLDPFWVKLTNVGIHLLNGLLLFLMLRELLRLWALARQKAGLAVAEAQFGMIAALIAGAWLLLPINLSGVAYVSQRMESLANVFVFLGLFWYLRVRQALYAGKGNPAMLWISLLTCMLAGFCAKESAALLSLYTACAEFAITGFRNRDGRYCRPALWAHIAFLVVPFALGLIWVSTWAFRGIANFREFTTGERLLTEARVLADYIGWTLLPNLNSLTFYHDDLAISHGLLDPPTTLLAILALIGLLAVAIWQRRARPLFCLGVLWFFAGHSMTGTIIALELVFEHRNYFPSLGLLLAAASLVALEPGLHRASAKTLIASGFIIFFAFTTFLRAQEWSHPLRLAYSEALKRPDSPRAQYGLARTLIQAAGSNDKSPLIAESVKMLERSAFLPSSGIAPLQALIFVAGRSHRPIDPRWWQAILRKLEDTPPSQSDIDAIAFLLRCQSHGECPLQTQELLDVFTLALAKSNGNVYLKSAYSDFAFSQLRDPELAERMAREAVAARPQVPTYRANLVHLLIAMRQFDDAEKAIDELATLDRLGSLDAVVAALRARLAAARAAASQAQPQQMPAGPTNR
jgi:hypothetical protein